MLDRPKYRFPHLLPEDAKLWASWLDAYGQNFRNFDYDIRVGLGRPATDEHTPEIQKMALDLSMRRIDVIGHTPTEIILFEVASSAGFTSVGQLVSYPILYRQTYKPQLPVKIVLLAAQIQTDIFTVLESLQITTYLKINPSKPPAHVCGDLPDVLVSWGGSGK